MINTRWQLYQRESDSLLAHLCRIRGLDPEKLTPSYKEQLHNPNLLPGVTAARQLVKEAVKKKWFVTVFGDYDADGTPAAALLSSVLDRLGVKHQVILPTRQTGYGLNVETIESLKDTTKLLITVDTGITAVEEITLASKYGIKVIVIDHHLPKNQLPPTEAIIDPFIKDATYPFPHLCGCALAYKFTLILREDFPEQLSEGFCKWLLDLVAISTVADMMPLIGENRVLVHYGLQVLAKTKRPGLIELMRQAGISPDKLSSYSLGYMLGPRLNASGRLFDNRPAFDLLVSKSIEEARPIAEKIEQSNQERQEAVKAVQTMAEKILWQQNKQIDKFLVVSAPDWPAGVLGLVAGKLTAQTNRPVAVLTVTPNGLTGSARSTENYSLIDGLENSQKYLTRFGGHKLAAGLATTADNFPKFVDSIKGHADKLIKPEEMRPTMTIDADINEAEVTEKTVTDLEKMAPFGQANPMPTLLISQVRILSPRRIGGQGNHFKAIGKKENQSFDIIGFNLSNKYFTEPLDEIDIIGNLEMNIWNGRKSLQLKVKDFRLGGMGADKVIALPAG